MLRLGIASGDWISPNRADDNAQHWGGSGWARVGKYIPYMPFDVYTGTLTWNKTHLAVMTPDGEMHDVDVILMQRLMHRGIADNIKISRAQGIKVINDIDDWYWGVATSNMAFDHNHPQKHPNENTNHYRATLAASDLVLSSTEYLASRVSTFINGDIEVVKNTVDIGKYSPHEDSGSTTPVVGWVGSTAHRSGDIETLRGVLDRLAKENSIILYHGGHLDRFPTFASKLGVPNHLVMTAPIATTDMYPSLMIMDIGIVPLSNTPFNRCKSDIKGLEYAAAGIPFIAQNMDAYIDLQSELGVGRIAKRATNWLRHLNELRLNPTLRSEEGAFNREAIAPRDIKHGAQKLVDIISNL